jgi:apolipoprotein N-acyltransferase
VNRFATPLALLGGALLGAAFSLERAWLGTFVAIASLVLSLEWSSSRSESAFRGAVFGWSGYVGGFFWLQPALASFWGGREALTWGVWIVWGCWVALRFVVIAWGYRALRDRKLGVLLSLILPWLVVEWLYPSVFPFYLANPFIDQTVLAQAAALGGPLLLSAWVCGIGVLLAESAQWLWGRSTIPRAEWATMLLATAAVVAYGATSMRLNERQTADAPGITVGVVQANVDVMKKRTDRMLSHRRHLDQSEALDGDVDLLVWPETSYLHALPHTLPSSGAAIVGHLRTPLLFGGIRKDAQSRRFNSALMVDADGVIRTAYDKRFLVPFAEFVPLGERFPWWGRIAPTLSRFHAGDAGEALRLGDWRIATPICYETIRPGYVRTLVRRSQPHLLVSLTNDAWFGDTPEPLIHLRLARFRAIEHRRYLVRATNTGISAVIDPTGRVVAETETFEAATLVEKVLMLDQETIYQWLGDWPGYLSAFGLLLLLAKKPLD